MIIEVGNIDKIDNSKTLIEFSDNFLYYLGFIKPEFRINILKNEILNNIPKVKTNINDLYIYIRSGDIFNNPNKFYSQPPLCFYVKIINNNKFNNIYIIAEDKNNRIIDELINKFPKIKYNKNILKIDIAYLIYAYNLVGGVSTFINILIRFNDNLKKYWEYNINTIEGKIIHFHYSIYNFKRYFTIFLMEPSFIYKKIMYPWNNTKLQKDLMLKEICYNDFNIISF